MNNEVNNKIRTGKYNGTIKPRAKKKIYTIIEVTAIVKEWWGEEGAVKTRKTTKLAAATTVSTGRTNAIIWFCSLEKSHHLRELQ